MAKKILPLTALQVKNAKAKDKDYSLFDGGGGHLLVKTNGSKIWRLKYRMEGKERRCTIGHYPEMSLEEFRVAVTDFKKQIANGIDVIKEKSTEQAQDITFAQVATEWYDAIMAQNSQLTDIYKRHLQSILSLHLIPELGNLSIKLLTRAHVLPLITKLASAQIWTVLKSSIAIGRQVCAFAIAKGYITFNPFTELKSFIPRIPPAQHYPTLYNPSDIAQLINDILAYKKVSLIIASEMLFSILTLARQNESRHARWEQIDFEKMTWTISAEDMKARREHVVPLSTGAMDILFELKNLALSPTWIFPSMRTGNPLSVTTCYNVLKGYGYKGAIVPHGFRAMASTMLNEMCYPRDWIDISLAHNVGNAVSQAYNRATLLEFRRRMLEEWYLYLMDLKNGMREEDAFNLHKFKGF